MNPFALALQAYHSDGEDASFTISRDDGFEQAVPVKMFFESERFSDFEMGALNLCFGSVLDVGAAAGRHSLELHRRRLEVWSLEVLPEIISIMAQRGVPHPVTGDVLVWKERRFDTVLMLMNGIGMVGTPERLDEFLCHAHRLVAPGGQLLCDSVDVSLTQDPVHVAYRLKNRERGAYPGQQRFTIQYDGIVGAPFDWLHLDFESLSRHCEAAGWKCHLVRQDPDGRYLARVIESN